MDKIIDLTEDTPSKEEVVDLTMDDDADVLPLETPPRKKQKKAVKTPDAPAKENQLDNFRFNTDLFSDDTQDYDLADRCLDLENLLDEATTVIDTLKSLLLLHDPNALDDL